MGKKIQSRKALHHERSKPPGQGLKIGMIFECTRTGPDRQVCEYVVKRLQPHTEVISRTLDNKPNLIAECGKTTALLLQEKCHRVVIVWDLHPPWRLEDPRGQEECLHEEREGIFESLKQAGVTSENVYLVCICKELETWLIADNGAVGRAISRLTGRKKPRIAEEKDPESVVRPKARLDNIFRQHTHRQYQAHDHALRIVKELPDFTKLKRCKTFKRFVLKTTGISL